MKPTYRAYFRFAVDGETFDRVCHNFRNRRSSNWSSVDVAVRNLEREYGKRFKTTKPEWCQGRVFDSGSNLVYTMAM